jgi:hypothetical protein
VIQGEGRTFEVAQRTASSLARHKRRQTNTKPRAYAIWSQPAIAGLGQVDELRHAAKRRAQPVTRRRRLSSAVLSSWGSDIRSSLTCPPSSTDHFLTKTSTISTTTNLTYS